ncbi:MAG: S-layer homology domain-containing protein [Candidatus Gastranaerophilaceae bacterium]
MKKILNILAITVAIYINSLVPANAFYSDMDETHWAYKQIKQLSEQSVVVGYPDGTFKPDENVTRAEFASMAIKALGQEHTTVAQPVKFNDIDTEFWAYNAIQKAIYFDLISNPETEGKFRPYDPVSRAESLAIAVNALTTEQISEQKAKYVLSKVYKDTNEIPNWFIIPAGKAEILGMLVCAPTNKGVIEADRPATRAEVTAILYNMMEQAKLNPNAKLAEAMRKKTGEGYIIENAFVQGAVGTIPAGSVVPIKVGTVMGSQISKSGDAFIAKTPQHFITKDKYILIYKGTDIKGQVCQVRPGKLFVRNGILTLSTDTIVTPNDQAVIEHGTSNVTIKKTKFMTWIRKIFKGEKIIVLPDGTVYVKLLDTIKVDLTNGWIFE